MIHHHAFVAIVREPFDLNRGTGFKIDVVSVVPVEFAAHFVTVSRRKRYATKTIR